MIKEKTRIIEEQKIWEVEIDGYTEECYSKEAAQEKLKQLKKTKEERLEDFLIAEKLFDYKWINFCNDNYLVSPYIFKTSYKQDNEKCKKDGLEISGIFSNSMSDEGWQPPEYKLKENFIDLIAAVSKLDYEVSFYEIEDEAYCLITLNGRSVIEIVQKKKKDYWSTNYCYCLALKEAVYQFCLIIEKENKSKT